MNRLLLSFVAFSVAAIFLSSANAETFEVEVPFDYNKSGCTLTANATDYKFYECYASYQKYNATSFLPDLVWDEVDKEYKTPEQLEEEAKADYQIWLEDQSTFEDPHLQAQVNRLGDSVSDDLATKFINNYIGGLCFQGAPGTTTAGLQNENSFEIPTIDEVRWIDGEKVIVQVLDRSQTTNEDLKGIVGYIISHQQECIAQGLLTDEDGGILSEVDTRFAYCDEFAEILNSTQSVQSGCGVTDETYYNELTESTPVWSQARVNQEANMSDTADRDPLRKEICDLYSRHTQIALGCEVPKDTTSRTTGNSEIQNDAEDRMNQYLEDGGKSQAQELRKKAIQDKISELFRQLKAEGSQ